MPRKSEKQKKTSDRITKIQIERHQEERRQFLDKLLSSVKRSEQLSESDFAVRVNVWN